MLVLLGPILASAARAVTGSGAAEPIAVDVARSVIAACDDGGREARGEARARLVSLAAGGRDVLPVLEAMLATGRFNAAWDSVDVAGHVADARLVPFLVEAATRVHEDADVDHHVRWRACWALHAVEVRSREGDPIEALEVRLRDPDGDVRHRAAIALGVLGEDEAATVLERSLESPDAFTRWEARFVLDRLASRPCPPSSPSFPTPVPLPKGQP
jgi:HEAT repeat protein